MVGNAGQDGIKRGSVMHGCRICDWDACAACFDRAQESARLQVHGPEPEAVEGDPLQPLPAKRPRRGLGTGGPRPLTPFRFSFLVKDNSNSYTHLILALGIVREPTVWGFITTKYIFDEK